MTAVAVALGALLGLLISPVGEWRVGRQSGYLAKLERKVAELCSTHPGLAWASGLKASDFSMVEPPEIRRPERGTSGPARRHILLALALREESREHGDEAIYLPNTLTRKQATLVAAAVGAAGGYAVASVTGEGPLLAAAVAVLSFAAVSISYVDCRTYLIDLKVAGAGAGLAAALAGMHEYVSYGTFSRTSGALLASLAGAALYSALGSVALLARKARKGERTLVAAVALTLAVVASFAAPYALAIRTILEGEQPALLWALSILPLAAVAFAGRHTVSRFILNLDRKGRVRLSEGPTAGVGDGDLLMMPLVVALPVMIAGSAALPLLLALPALISLAGIGARYAAGRPSSAPLPFAPALLASALLVISVSDRLPGML